jgi:hypothetical protein
VCLRANSLKTVEDDKMERECSMNGSNCDAYNILVEKGKVKREEVIRNNYNLPGNIILKLIFEK